MSSTGRRGWRLAASVVAVVLLATACQGGDGGESEESGPVELTLLDHQKPRVDLMKQLLPKFEQAMAAQGKQITVKLLEGPAPDDQFTTKLTLDFNSGNAADVSSFTPADAVNFGSSGFLLDLTDRVKQWPDWEGHFYQRLREEQVQADGKVYAIPREATIMQLFYRKDVLEREGISTEQPRSWQELLDRMRQATRAIGSPALLFPAGTAWGGGTFGEGFIHLMLGTGSPLYQDGKWVVRSPGLTQVLGFYEQMTNSGVLPVQPLLNPEPWVPTKYEAFPKGELVATTCGTWCWIFDWGPQGSTPIKDIFDKVATWEFPTSQGGETFVWGASGWVWGIADQTKHPDAAWELVKWLAGGEAMARNAVTVGAASPRDDLAGVAPYSEYEYLIAAEKQLAKARSFANPEGVDKMGQAVGEATEAIITKKANAQQAADLLAERATELLGERNVMEL
jgi:multiple sugar transport system substrate-binding protein